MSYMDGSNICTVPEGSSGLHHMHVENESLAANLLREYLTYAYFDLSWLSSLPTPYRRRIRWRG